MILQESHVAKRKKFSNITLLDELEANPQRYQPTAFHKDFPLLNDPKCGKLFGRKGKPFGTEIKYRIYWDLLEKKAIGAISFGNNCEGPPGSVHGGCLATAFDNSFGIVSSRALGFGCVTLNLSVNYKNFVKLDATVRVDIEVEKIEENKIYLKARFTDNLNSIKDPENIVTFCTSTSLFYKRYPDAWSFEQAYELFGPNSKLTQEQVVQIITKLQQQDKTRNLAKHLSKL